MKEIPLIIIGAGKSTIEIIDLINDINLKKKQNIKVIGVLDDDKKILNKKINDSPVIGSLREISKFKKEKFFLSILSYKNRFKRNKIIKKLKKIKNEFINIVHPSSIMGKYVKIGKGCLIGNNCNIYSHSTINNFCYISPNVSLASYASLKDNCIIGNSSVVSANASIEENTYIGLKSVILDDIKIASGSRIMPNSIITKNIEKRNSISFGAPAKIIGYDNYNL